MDLGNNAVIKSQVSIPGINLEESNKMCEVTFRGPPEFILKIIGKE